MNKKVCFLALTVLSVHSAFAADVSGKWTYETTDDSGNTVKVRLNLKTDGDVLKGTVSIDQFELAISDGKVDGSDISFAVKPEFGGATWVAKFKGSVDGDELKLKITRESEGGHSTTTATARRCPPDCS